MDFQSGPGDRIGIHISQHDVGIGDSGFSSAVAVANRTGLRAGAARTNAQGATVIKSGDAAASRAGLDDIDRRHAHDMSATAEQTSGIHACADFATWLL